MIAACFVVMARLNAHLFNRTNLVVHSLLKIISTFIILLGVLHISFAFPIDKNIETLWFIGAGFSIIFSGLLNLVSINKGGSGFTKSIALFANVVNCIMFCYALSILNQPQIYVGIGLFVIASAIFVIDLLTSKRNK